MTKQEEIKEDVLTWDTLQRALECSSLPPSCEPSACLHPSLWEDYRKAFNLTEEQMNKIFVKSNYIEVE